MASEIQLDQGIIYYKEPIKPKLLGVPLIIEEHPTNYTGLPYLTLIQYHDKSELTIIDNYVGNQIRAYVLDMCSRLELEEQPILMVADHWFKTARFDYPISIAFTKAGLTPVVEQLLKSYSVDFITRIIGPVPKFPMGNKSTNTVKRRKCKVVQTDIEVVECFFKT